MVTAHDCGHACCDERSDPMHDHFLTPDACPSCARRPRPADVGHTFRLAATSRMSSMVAGDDHYRDAEEFGSTALVLYVRAWDLPAALAIAAERPLSDWTHEEQR